MTLQNKSSFTQTRVFRIALLSSLAAILHILESYISLPIPFFRIGLSNVIILLLIFNNDYLSALFVAVNKTLLGNFFAGKLLSLSFILSLSGSLISTICMVAIFSLPYYKVSKNCISITGSIINNLIQYTLFLFIVDRNINFMSSGLTTSIVVFSIFSGIINAWIVYKLNDIFSIKYNF